MIHDKEETPYILSDITFSKDDEQEQLNFYLLDHPTYWNNLRYKCGVTVNNIKVQKAVLFLIVINSLLLGIQTFDFVLENPGFRRIFVTVDFVCLCLFSIELLMQIFYRQMDIIRDNWLMFDIAVITMSWMSESLGVGRGFRVIRASRIVYRIHGLRVLMIALHACIPKIFSVAVLLVLVMYVYGVIFTTLFKDMYKQGFLDEDYFSRLDKTFFTLFQMMTMDSWTDIAKQVMVVYPWAWVTFVSYLLTTSFLILNLAMGIIAGAVASAHNDDIEKTLIRVGSNVGEKNDSQILSLHRKIDELTLLVESLVQDKIQSSHTIVT
jgi:hypothetical protein